MYNKGTVGTSKESYSTRKKSARRWKGYPSGKAGISFILVAVVVAVVAIVSASAVYLSYGSGGATQSGGLYSPSATTTMTAPTTTNPGRTSVSLVSIASGAHNSAQSNNFVPDKITVVIGVNNTVTWTNNDSVEHTVTSDTSGQFSSGVINAGSTFSFTFTTPGVYAYHCSIHPFMKGTIEVIQG